MCRDRLCQCISPKFCELLLVAYDYFSFKLLPADSRLAQKSVHNISSSFIANACGISAWCNWFGIWHHLHHGISGLGLGSGSYYGYHHHHHFDQFSILGALAWVPISNILYSHVLALQKLLKCKFSYFL